MEPERASLRGVGSNKGVSTYLLIAFGLAWLLWEIPIRMGVPISHPLFQMAILPGAFSPAVACVVVRKWITGEGFGDAGLKLNLRRSWRYHLVGWLLPVAVVAVIAGLAVVFGVAHPDWSMRQAVESLAPGAEVPPTVASLMWLLVPAQLLLTALMVTPLLWGEEFGWRGYLQLRLFPGRPLLAAVATGLIWGIWHYPLLLRGYNFPVHPLLGLAVFPVGTVLLSIVFGWLRAKTGSVWSPSVAHSSTNAVGGSLISLIFVGQTETIFVGYLGMLSWVPLGLFCAWIVLTGRLARLATTSEGSKSAAA